METDSDNTIFREALHYDNVEPSLNFEERKQVEGPYLQFDNVSFKYNENGQEALKNISFSLKKNERGWLKTHVFNHPLSF